MSREIISTLLLFGTLAVNGQILAPLSGYSQTYCGRFPYQQNASDLCCNGYHFPNLPLPMHKACCQSGFYDTRLFGCDGSKTFLLSGTAGGLFPFGMVRQQVLDRVVPTNYYCGTNMYDPNTQYCCGCCGDGDRKVINKTDKYSLCCNGRWVVNPERVLACCGINAYDTRFYMCTPPLEVVPRRPPLQPFVPTDFCEGRGYNPQTDYCCGSSVLPKNSSQALCCNGKFFTVPDKSSYACCCDSFYNTATQTCDKDCMVKPIDKGGPKPLDYCGDRIYNPLEDSCCGNVFIANNSIGHYLCCDNVYYANVHPNLACCGKNVYDIYHYRCQDYHIIPLQPATVTVVNNINLPRYCGGTVPYESTDGMDGLCCRGLYYPNAEGNGQCCGSALFVPSLHTCREDVVYFNGVPLPQPSIIYLPPTKNFEAQAHQYWRNLDAANGQHHHHPPSTPNHHHHHDFWPLFGMPAEQATRQVQASKPQQLIERNKPFGPHFPFNAVPPYPTMTIQSEVPQLGRDHRWDHVLVPRDQLHHQQPQPRSVATPLSPADSDSDDDSIYLVPKMPQNDPIVPQALGYFRAKQVQQRPEDPNSNVFDDRRINAYYGPVVPTGPVSRLPNGQIAILANVEQISDSRRTNSSIKVPWPNIHGAMLNIPAGIETQPPTYRYQWLQPRDPPTYHGGQSFEPPVEKARPLPASPYGYEYSLLCNGQPFDSKVHFCCGGQLIRIRPDPYQLCCGDIYYDNVNKDPSLICCGRRVCRWDPERDGLGSFPPN